MPHTSFGSKSDRNASGRSETVNNPWNFWRTTGCATVAAALIGVGGTLLAQQIGKGKSQSSAPPTVTVTQRPDQQEPAPPTAGPDSDLLWKDHFNMESYVSFDVIPPRNDAPGGLTEDVTGNYYVHDDGAIWDSLTPPSKQQCIDRIGTHAQDRIAADEGTQFCYRTSRGRIVFIDILNVQPGDGFISSPRFETEATIWRN